MSSYVVMELALFGIMKVQQIELGNFTNSSPKPIICRA